MCNPGISPSKTDAQLASALRHHIQAANVIRNTLFDRGYCVDFRGGSGHSVPAIEEITITKEVSL